MLGHTSMVLHHLMLYVPCVSLCTVVGVFVNREGRRSRKQELLWHSAPTSFGELSKYDALELPQHG